MQDTLFSVLTSFFTPMALFWLVAMLVFAGVEAATVGLVSIWFAAGSLVALIAAGLNAPLWLQIILFLSVSAIMLALLRPFLKRVAIPNLTATNADRNIGRKALVIEEINNLAGKGAIRLDGVIWSARTEQDEIIPVGETVQVLRIAGVKLMVAPVDNNIEVQV